MSTSTNPLSKHFRQPAIYIKLTSKGKYWPDGAVDMPVTGEIPVYPMTAKDEIILRTPDALITGTAVVQVIQSCCPNIKDAWAMPSVDVDSTLIAIRLASYGQQMSVTAECPHCKEEHDYEIDLLSVLDKIRMPDYSQTVTLPDGVVIKLKPMNYLQVSKSGNITFEEEKMVQSLVDPDLDENVRKVEFEKHLNKINDLNHDNLTNCTDTITTPDGTVVTNAGHIKEYYQNIESTVLRKLHAQIENFSEEVKIKSESTVCTACEAEFKLSVEFDFAHFFGVSS